MKTINSLFTAQAPAGSTLPRLLTLREVDLLLLLAQGQNNTAIASELGLGVDTIRTYLVKIYRKLGVTTRLQAALWTLENRSALS